MIALLLGRERVRHSYDRWSDKSNRTLLGVRLEGGPSLELMQVTGNRWVSGTGQGVRLLAGLNCPAPPTVQQLTLMMILRLIHSSSSSRFIITSSSILIVSSSLLLASLPRLVFLFCFSPLRSAAGCGPGLRPWSAALSSCLSWTVLSQRRVVLGEGTSPPLENGLA